MRDAIARMTLLGATLAAALALTPTLRAADDNGGPELDPQRIATCEARGGRLARNHQGQMLCKGATIKIVPYLRAHPEAAVVPPPAASAPAPGVTQKGPTYTPTTTGTFTIPAGTPEFGTGIPGSGVLAQQPPAGKAPAPGAGGKTPPAVPPALQPTKTPGGTCYLRSCLFSSYTKSCQCQEFNSTELCQFKETAPGGKCADGGGYTTALCPAGYSCINNSCRKEPSC